MSPRKPLQTRPARGRASSPGAPRATATARAGHLVVALPSRLAAFYRRSEAEPQLATLKALASRALSLRGRSVLLQCDLAVALHALGRDDDALAVCDWPQRSVQYRGKAGAWYAASVAWAIGARIRRSRGLAEEALRGLTRFVERPAHAMLVQPRLWNLARLRAVAREQTVRFGDAARREGVLATDSMAFAIGELIYLRETAVPPFPHAALDLRWLDKLIAGLVTRLSSRLRGSL